MPRAGAVDVKRLICEHSPSTTPSTFLSAAPPRPLNFLTLNSFKNYGIFKTQSDHRPSTIPSTVPSTSRRQFKNCEKSREIGQFTNLPAYHLTTCLPTYITTSLPTCLPTYLPVYLPHYLPAFLPGHLST